MQSGDSGHWGADDKMQDMIFRGPVPDPLGQTAGSRAGALSIMIGVTARRSVEQQRPIAVEELVKIRELRFADSHCRMWTLNPGKIPFIRKIN